MTETERPNDWVYLYDNKRYTESFGQRTLSVPEITQLLNQYFWDGASTVRAQLLSYKNIHWDPAIRTTDTAVDSLIRAFEYG